MSKVPTRYAPSPTGKMHVGNLCCALYEFVIAKHCLSLPKFVCTSTYTS